jgi:hypothetical protein
MWEAMITAGLITPEWDYAVEEGLKGNWGPFLAIRGKGKKTEKGAEKGNPPINAD